MRESTVRWRRAALRSAAQQQQQQQHAPHRALPHARSRPLAEWVTAEGIAAAALLARHSAGADRGHFLSWYDRFWRYAWEHLVDHEFGSWFRALGEKNEKLDDIKCPHGKADYHLIGMCLDAADALEEMAK